MNFVKAMGDIMLKAEDPAGYAKLAREGRILLHPVSIGRNNKRPDNGVPYHTTVKFFNPEKDSHDDIHRTASNLDLTPPNSKEVGIEPSMIKDRVGNDIYIITLHGPHADKLKEHHEKFSHMGHPENYEYHPHISVDKSTWHKIIQSGAKTAHDAGISFGPAQLKEGHAVVQHYHSKIQKAEVCMPKEKYVAEHKKLIGTLKHPTKSKLKEEAKEQSQELKVELEKSSMKHIGAALGLMSGIASTAMAPTTEHTPYSTDKMLRTISSVESQSGLRTQHKETERGRAYGQYAVMPDTIHETIRMHPDLKKQHKKALFLSGEDLHNYMKDNPGLDKEIAKRHVKRLEHHFGSDPTKIGYAWLRGITGTNADLINKVNIGDHWHAKKIKNAYKEEK